MISIPWQKLRSHGSSGFIPAPRRIRIGAITTHGVKPAMHIGMLARRLNIFGRHWAHRFAAGSRRPYSKRFCLALAAWQRRQRRSDRLLQTDRRFSTLRGKAPKFTLLDAGQRRRCSRERPCDTSRHCRSFRFAAQPYIKGGYLFPMPEDWTRPLYPLRVIYQPNRHLNARLGVAADRFTDVFMRVSVR